MKCLYCGCKDSKVLDSRSAEDGMTIRRRRECLECGKRFTTYERIELEPIVVIKKDNSRQTFQRYKVMAGLLRACEKRPINTDQLEAIVDRVEGKLSDVAHGPEREVTTAEIGKLILQELKEIDEVSYIRFASVYRQFEDVDSFMEELKRLREQKIEEK